MTLGTLLCVSTDDGHTHSLTYKHNGLDGKLLLPVMNAQTVCGVARERAAKFGQ